MKRYADVSLPVNLDREFTYLIPPGLESAALVGTRDRVDRGTAAIPRRRRHA